MATFDFSKKAVWANEKTGLSAEFWGRAMGWYVVAAIDIASYLPSEHPLRSDFINLGVDLIKSLAKYQEKSTGLWYQVINKGELPDNWLETSCSCLFLYAILLAVEIGAIEKSAVEAVAKETFAAIASSLAKGEDGYIGVRGVCIGTGVDAGTYEHYIARPTVENDLHGVGAFLLMASQYAKIFENEGDEQ